MNLREFLADPSVQLPITRDSDDFQGFIEKVLDGYINKLSQLSADSEITNEVLGHQADVAHFCKAAKEVIRSTFEGRPFIAWAHFVESVRKLKPFIEKQTIRDLTNSGLPILYRVRRQSGGSLTREALFHIPFELRHLVATQRYSIPGIPCLYLSGSLYTCWAEMGHPPFHELQAAAFWLTNNAKVSILNLSDRPKRLLLFFNEDGTIQKYQQIKNAMVNHLLLWPLVAMCSIRVKHRDSPYKPEYIYPQIVLQWISQQEGPDEYQGVSYFSTHVDGVSENPIHTSNFVFPAKKVKQSGRCPELRDQFRMTDPRGWQLLSSIQITEHGGSSNDYPIYDFEFIQGLKEPYHQTEFGNVEANLNKLARLIIDNDNPSLGKVAE